MDQTANASGPAAEIETALEQVEDPALAKLNEFIHHGRLKIEVTLANAERLATAHPLVAALLPIIKQVFVEQLHHFATYATEHYVDPTSPPAPQDTPATETVSQVDAPQPVVAPAPLPPEPAPPAADGSPAKPS